SDLRRPILSRRRRKRRLVEEVIDRARTLQRLRKHPVRPQRKQAARRRLRLAPRVRRRVVLSRRERKRSTQRKIIQRMRPESALVEVRAIRPERQRQQAAARRTLPHIKRRVA